ncbi:MAG: hypothetical protein ACLFPQ_04705, partial [Candidatus Woesearchaeota archaeon]
VATRLQYEMNVPVDGDGSGSVVVVGDSAKAETASDIFEIGEYLGNVKEVYIDSNLNALESGSVRNSKGTFAYNQYIEFPANAGLKIDFVEDSDRDEFANYLTIADEETLYTYNLEFSTPLESDIDSENNLEDIQDRSITIMGKQYTITRAEVDTDADDITLEILGGEASETLEEGATKTITVNNKEYDVTASYIGTISGITKVKFTVTYDGTTEITDSIAAGETYVLDDGTEIGVREALVQDGFSGFRDFTEFYLGADKMVLTDSDYTSTAQGSGSLEVGSETLSDAKVSITADDTDSGVLKISRIQVNIASPDDIFVPEGGSLSEELESDERGILLGNNFDIRFEGITTPSGSEAEISSSGDDNYEFTFVNKAGTEITVPIWHASEDNLGYVGNEDGRFWTAYNASSDPFISADDMFIVGDGTKDVEDRYTYVLRYDGYDSDDRELSFEDLGTGNTLQYTLNQDDEANILLGGKQFNVAVSDASSDDTMIWADLDGDGNANAVSMPATTRSGVWFDLPSMNQSNPNIFENTAETVEMTWNVPAEKMDDTSSDTGTITFDVAASDAEVDMSISGINLGEIGNSDKFVGYTPYGLHFENDRSTSSPDELSITIPEEQVKAQVFLTAGNVESRDIESSDAVQIAPIAVGAARLDSDSQDWRNHNVIVVGGPCANTVAAELLDVEYGSEACRAGFEPGQAMIRLFENNGNVAMLVAGYNAEDTLRATKVVHNYMDYDEFKGTEVIVSGTTMSDIEVSPVE